MGDERRRERKGIDSAMIGVLVAAGQLHRDWANLLAAPPPPPSERPQRTPETKAKWRTMFRHLQTVPEILKLSHRNVDTVLRDRFGLRMGESVLTEGLWIFAAKAVNDEIQIADDETAELEPMAKVLATFTPAQQAEIAIQLIKTLNKDRKIHVLEALTQGVNEED